MVQGDSADSMLTWVLGQRGQEAIKDPDLAKQVTLAVLRQAIPNPKVCPHSLCNLCGRSAGWQVFCGLCWVIGVLPAALGALPVLTYRHVCRGVQGCKKAASAVINCWTTSCSIYQLEADHMYSSLSTHLAVILTAGGIIIAHARGSHATMACNCCYST